MRKLRLITVCIFDGLSIKGSRIREELGVSFIIPVVENGRDSQLDLSLGVMIRGYLEGLDVSLDHLKSVSHSVVSDSLQPHGL